MGGDVGYMEAKGEGRTREEATAKKSNGKVDRRMEGGSEAEHG